MFDLLYNIKFRLLFYFIGITALIVLVFVLNPLYITASFNKRNIHLQAEEHQYYRKANELNSLERLNQESIFQTQDNKLYRLLNDAKKIENKTKSDKAIISLIYIGLKNKKYCFSLRAASEITTNGDIMFKTIADCALNDKQLKTARIAISKIKDKKIKEKMRKDIFKISLKNELKWNETKN